MITVEQTELRGVGASVGTYLLNSNLLCCGRYNSDRLVYQTTNVSHPQDWRSRRVLDSQTTV